MFHVLYKISNTVNDKIYIGIHSTTNINDSYMGSGVRLKSAFEKYGSDNFTKEILHTFCTRDEASLKEAEIVTPEFILREDTYNLIPGGVGGDPESTRKQWEDPITREKRVKSIAAYWADDANRQKASETRKAYFNNLSDSELIQVKQKMAKNRASVNKTPVRKAARSIEQKKLWEDPVYKKKMSDAHKGQTPANVIQVKLIDPDGNTHVAVNGLHKFCKANNLSHKMLKTYVGEVIKESHAKRKGIQVINTYGWKNCGI